MLANCVCTVISILAVTDPSPGVMNWHRICRRHSGLTVGGDRYIIFRDGDSLARRERGLAFELEAISADSC